MREDDQPAAPRTGGSVWRRVLVLSALCGVVALLVSFDAVYSLLARLLTTTEQLLAADPVAGAALFVVFAALSGMLAFFSSAVLVPVAVHAWGPVYCAGLLWLGWILGGCCTYLIGRYLGRPVVRFLVPGAGLARLEQKVSREMPFGLVFLLQTAMPSEVPGYVLGLVRYRFLRYLVVLAIVELPYAIGTVILGDSFVRRQLLPFLVLGVAAALLSGFAYARLHRRLEQT